uniref:Uncharacterized protein n=1 Tax=Micromonospora carbonacea TaxID=47853 RepID=A0A7D5YID5_9ACTN|nr:hypothetical protein HZU44_08960 [Micromonospora carbonacea]
MFLARGQPALVSGVGPLVSPRVGPLVSPRVGPLVSRVGARVWHRYREFLSAPMELPRMCAQRWPDTPGRRLMALRLMALRLMALRCQ